MFRFFKCLRQAVCLFAILCAFAGSSPSYAQDKAEDAFKNFIKKEDFNNANFYLENKYIDPSKINVSQLFYEVLKEVYFRDLGRNLPKVEMLFNYMSRMAPVDLNRVMDCGRSKCLLALDLLAGGGRDTIRYFVERGLDLNRAERGFIPTSMPVLVRLGSVYSVEDMNFLVSNGLVIGDELYPIEQLSNYRDGYLSGDALDMPQNYLELKDQNLLDAAVIALGTEVDENAPRASLRRKTLCEFITYAAQSFQPSFDYLLYLLKVSDTFRGQYVGKTEQSGNSIYQPFPNACVSLIQSMAASHAQLEGVISDFANNKDVQTAQWLISIRRGN
jgi:hypothetical protein